MCLKIRLLSAYLPCAVIMSRPLHSRQAGQAGISSDALVRGGPTLRKRRRRKSGARYLVQLRENTGGLPARSILVPPDLAGRTNRNQLEQILGRGVSSGRGWIMYCDGCGTQLTPGGQFCTKCGKPIVPSAVASSPGSGQAGEPSTAAAADGRVRRNIHRLAILWK